MITRSARSARSDHTTRWTASAVLALAVVTGASTGCQPGDEEDAERQPSSDVGATTAVPADAEVAWSAPVEEDWDVTAATSVDGVVLASSSWNEEEDAVVNGYDPNGTELWEYGIGYGHIVLTVLDDGTVRACDSLGGDILDPGTGAVVREATVEECPEDFDRPGWGDAWVVDGGIVSYDDITHELRFHPAPPAGG